MISKIRALAKELGASDIGFSQISPPDEFSDCKNAISIVIKLSSAIIDTIEDAPTHTYFHHYRTVNALIDHITLRIGLMLGEAGYKYVCIPASQSIEGLKGLFSHKIAATKAGLGSIGKNALFLSDRFGPAVRLGTILTDCDLSGGYRSIISENPCINCSKCVKICPAMAISGKDFDVSHPEKPIVDSLACSKYMKEKFQHIGRGVVCGLCISCCPVRK